MQRCEGVGCWLALAAVAVLGMGSFLVAGAVAEGALHPLIKRRASDTAALAYSIAHAVNGTAIHVSIRAQDGTSLDGWWLMPSKPNGEAVMVCHGVVDSAYGALGFGLLFLKNGYSVLMPESRGHGESEGFVTYGVLESGDVVRWLGWMRRRGFNTVFGFGESLEERFSSSRSKEAPRSALWPPNPRIHLSSRLPTIEWRGLCPDGWHMYL